MTLAEAKELERLKAHEAASERAKEFDSKQKEIDGTISRHSGAWHAARTDLAFSHIEADIEEMVEIRKAMIEKCPDLATPHETLQFEQHAARVIEDRFQAALRVFPVMTVHPPASLLSQMPTRKRALQDRVRTASRMMQLEGQQQPLRNLPEQPRRMAHPSKSYRFQIALSFPGEYRQRVERIAEALAVRAGKENILYDQWHRAEFARPNLDVYLPKLYHDQSLLIVFFLCGEYAAKEWCGLEWRVGRSLLKQQEDDRLMFLRLDRADIPGLYSIDGYLDISAMPDEEVAVEILRRRTTLGAPALDTPAPLPSRPSRDIPPQPPSKKSHQTGAAKRERIGALAGAILLTVALPIAIDQGYFRYNVWALPSLGLVTALLYLGFFVTGSRCWEWWNNRRGLTLVGIIIAVLAIVGAWWVALGKSKQHVAVLISKDNLVPSCVS